MMMALGIWETRIQAFGETHDGENQFFLSTNDETHGEDHCDDEFKKTTQWQ
jgi:hypothetical protein